MRHILVGWLPALRWKEAQLVVALSVILGCESSAHKLERLQGQITVDKAHVDSIESGLMAHLHDDMRDTNGATKVILDAHESADFNERVARLRARDAAITAKQRVALDAWQQSTVHTLSALIRANAATSEQRAMAMALMHDAQRQLAWLQQHPDMDGMSDPAATKAGNASPSQRFRRDYIALSAARADLHTAENALTLFLAGR